ncbi:MAG: S8 family serine peptidase [Tannerella sp.]|jgi:subtilisin family serine protease|nr:S8 family serine peptidase [Tannerella sp.]
MILAFINRKTCRSVYRRIGAALLCILPMAAFMSADNSYCFRVYLKDKGETSFRISSPEAFLSPESVERRMLREVFVDDTDFPVSRGYIDELVAAGVSPVVQSKWMKTVVVESRDSAVVERLKEIPFVDSLKCVWNGAGRQDVMPCSEDDTAVFTSVDEPLENPYGYAADQLEMLNGLRLHAAGYRGKGLRIAVIDAGFMHADRMDAFSSMNLLGAHNITFPGRSVFCEDEHGTKVLSCMAANLPGIMIGSAPDASFLLIKSEDTRGEYLLEEDLWAAAVEYADSVGIDIISSSLGYFRFDSLPDYYTRMDLNGQTAFISRVADMAAKKGMLVVSSAGNEGNSEWEKITFPADASDILTVGSVTSDKEKSSFSSVGMTADYRIKPDVVALGTHVCVTGSAGQVQYTNGTSFSAPTVAGFAACLWQAFPLLKNTGLIELIKESSGQHRQPDAQMGYGIPDMFDAYNKANSDVLRNL